MYLCLLCPWDSGLQKRKMPLWLMQLSALEPGIPLIGATSYDDQEGLQVPR